MARAKVKALRLEKGLTVRAVSDATGLTEKTIGRVEKGGPLGAKAARRLADFFDVSVDAILGREGFGNDDAVHHLFAEWLEKRAPANLREDIRRAMALITPPADADHTFYPNIYRGLLNGIDAYEMARQLSESTAAKPPKAPSPTEKPAGRPRRRDS